MSPITHKHTEKEAYSRNIKDVHAKQTVSQMLRDEICGVKNIFNNNFDNWFTVSGKTAKYFLVPASQMWVFAAFLWTKKCTTKKQTRTAVEQNITIKALKKIYYNWEHIYIVVSVHMCVCACVCVSGCEAGYRKSDSFPLTFLPLFISIFSLNNMHVSFTLSTACALILWI